MSTRAGIILAASLADCAAQLTRQGDAVREGFYLGLLYRRAHERAGDADPADIRWLLRAFDLSPAFRVTP